MSLKKKIIARQSSNVQTFVRLNKTSRRVVHRGGGVSSTYPLLPREHATHNSPRRMTLIHDFLIAIYTGQRLITLWRLCRGRARVDKAGLQDRSAATHPRTTSYPRAEPLEPHHDPDTSKMAVMKHSEEQRRTICFVIDLKGAVFQTILNCWETNILLSDIKNECKCQY